MAFGSSGIRIIFTPPLRCATLIKRYKRFLADVITLERETLTLHCANNGTMTGCATPGDILSGIPLRTTPSANTPTVGS